MSRRAVAPLRRASAGGGTGRPLSSTAILGPVDGDRGEDLAEQLSRLRLTYAEQGGTAWAQLPVGYRHVHRSLVLGSGSEVFERACSGLMSWQLHRRAGFGVDGNAPTVVTGSCVLLIIGRRPVALTVPCRVVYTVTEKTRVGFGYGTLPGHPETGEEAFVVELGDDGRVTFTVRAFSNPATTLARIGGPVTRLVQDAATWWYQRTLKRIANS